MRLLDFLNELSQDEDKDKIIDDKLFDDEAESLGLDEWEKEEIKKIGITPEEWVKDNE